MDSRLKKQLNERVTRSQVELSLTGVETVDTADTVVAVNQGTGKSLPSRPCRTCLRRWRSERSWAARMIARFPDVLTTRHADIG